jgi:hypothetical protein
MKYILLPLCAALAACASPQTLYQWGEYQPALLAYAKNPQGTADFARRLQASIVKAEAENRVPPGMYAEYGYALLDLNRPADAVAQFTKERSKWPESAALMNRLIERVGRAPTPPAAAAAATSSALTN